MSKRKVATETQTLPISSLPEAVAAQAPDVLQPLPPGTVKLTGDFDRRLRRGIENHLKVLDCRKLADCFRERRNPFATGEFWGKTVRSMVASCEYAADPGLRRLVIAAAADLLSAQTPDGCLSTYAYEEQPKSSDLWDRKYCLLGLEAAYRLGRDPAVLAAMVRLADYTIGQIGPPPKVRIVDTGWAFAGIESSSILEPMVRLYRLTGHSRHLDFARYIVEEEGACGRADLFAAALAGVPPKDIGDNGDPSQSIAKAYESMSCFEGLVEYHRVTGESRWREAAVRYYEMVRDQEISLLGSGGADRPFNFGPGAGEQWNALATEQTNPDLDRMMETCVTVTWMKFCFQLLRLTGQSRIADQIERSMYNALAGAQRPDGAYYDYFQKFNGIRGSKVGFGADIAGFPLSCCTANGPAGLALIPQVAVMSSASGPVVNLYLPGSFEVPLAGGNAVRLEINTDYPRGEEIAIRVAPRCPVRFAIALRVPEWSERNSLAINGKAVEVASGAYAIVEREWRAGDRLELVLDLRCRLVPAPRGSNRAGDNFQALVRGPVLLARDRRLGGDLDAPVAIQADARGRVELKPADAGFAAGMCFQVPTDHGDFRVVDYASAGSTWSAASEFRSWLAMAT